MRTTVITKAPSKRALTQLHQRPLSRKIKHGTNAFINKRFDWERVNGVRTIISPSYDKFRSLFDNFVCGKIIFRLECNVRKDWEKRK